MKTPPSGELRREGGHPQLQRCETETSIVFEVWLFSLTSGHCFVFSFFADADQIEAANSYSSRCSNRTTVSGYW